MFNVIRIPTKFSRPIKRLSDKEKLKLLDALINVWDWIIVQQTDDTVWDLLSLIYWEWMNMESKNGHKKETEYVVTTVPSNPPSMSDCRVEESRIEYNRIEENIIDNTTIVVWVQALVKSENEKRIDNRNSGTQRIIDMVKNQVEEEWYLYDNNKEERNRATIISKRQSDWWLFIKETPEEREEEIIRSIISFSNQNEYSAKIRSVRDFHEKWKKVANSMKQENKKEQEIYSIPTY